MGARQDVPSRAGSWSRSLLGFVALSVLFHSLVGWVLGAVQADPVGPTRGEAPTPARLAFGAPPAELTGLERARLATDASAARPGGGRSWDNLSARAGGHGGDGRGAVEFTFLVARVDDVTLQDGLSNARASSQVQRIRTARDRASWEDRRATPNPGDDPFLASGMGRLRQRLPLAPTEAAAGSLRERARPSAAQATGAGLARGESGAANAAGGAPAADSRGGGAPAGRGTRRDGRSDVAHGRPPVDRGPAATLAEDTGRVRDDTDAERLASALVGSWVEASRRAGPRTGEGAGGSGGGGAASAGEGEGAGGLGRPSGGGPGDGFAPLGRRYRTWFLRQRRRVEQQLQFPRARRLARDQGVTVLRVRVRRDGSLAGPVRQVRSSGFSDLDDAAQRALAAALPFEALPDDIAPGREVLSMSIELEFENPMF